MSVRTTITNKGLQLLASSSQATGQYYWLGYYALAYVPDFWKTTEPTIDFTDPTCFKTNTGDIIDSGSTEPVKASMQRLTTNGDMIWNVWQGDLTGTGFTSESDGTPGGDLFGLTMYAQNVKKHYRYVLDENGNNILVTWINDPTSTTGEMKKQNAYMGTDGFVASELPIPAPLYYLGDVTGMLTALDYFPDFADSDENGSSIYPFIEVVTPSGNITVPKVSADVRGYLDTLGNSSSASYAPVGSGPLFYPAIAGDSNDIPIAVDPIQFDVTGWYAAKLTYTIPESTPDLNNNPAKFATEFWKLHTSSNYNRWHAPVDNVGFLLNSNLANRNMAKTTKFFPISNYKTINTDSGFTSNGEAVEVATAIQLTIDLDISPSTLTDGSDVSAVTSFDKYENADSDPAQSPVDQYGNSVYTATHSSMKFNRIGIYAVALRKHPCVQDQGFGQVPTSANGTATELQFQIDPDEEPVLFAVMDWDNTVTLDDTGNGLSSFYAEINVNLESPDGIEDTALIRDCTIFYNLYEDDALKWYQNQLIANAQTQNAITELGLEIGSLLSREGESECCPTPDLSELYAVRNHTHTGLGLRNLKDSMTAINGGLRGINTIAETTLVDAIPYELGLTSVALGADTIAAGDYSTVAGGTSNKISFNSHQSFIGGGQSNTIEGSSTYSIIGGGFGHTIEGSSLYAVILGGLNNNLITASESIVFGDGNTISNSVGSLIVGFKHNITISSHLAAIVGGTDSTITDDSAYSSVLGGRFNTITLSRESSIIGGNNNSISTQDSSFISNAIIGSTSSSILAESRLGSILSSSGGVILNSGYSSIIASNTVTITGTQRSAAIASQGISIPSGSSNVAAIARTNNIATASTNTLYTDNLNFVGQLNANNTLGTEGQVLTINGGVPEWGGNSGGFNWVDWPQPPNNFFLNIIEWEIQYSIVGDMVFLRGECELFYIDSLTTNNLLLDPNPPVEIRASAIRTFSLFDSCVGSTHTCRFQTSDNAFYVSDLKSSYGDITIGNVIGYGPAISNSPTRHGFVSFNGVWYPL